MNDPLECNFQDYGYSATDVLRKDTTDDLPTIDEADFDDAVENLPKCEICGREFVNKKALRAHIIIHLGQPRIVLKRCSALKSLKKKEKDTYWLDPETKGSLKLTLKKHQLYTTEALKLTLKKSPESEDFAVVNTNSELEENDDSRYEEEVEGSTNNVHMDDKAGEEENERQSYENVIVNEAEAYENEEDENYNEEETSNPLEDNEIPSLEANEGDSGVGSDMANPSERDDQNVDDLHTIGERSYDNNQEDGVAEENEDHEDTDALEATCRETIENLKKLGEHSSCRSLRSIGMLPRNDDEISIEPVNMTQNLDEETNLSVLSKSSSYPLGSPNDRRSPRTIDENQRSPGNESNFNWNHLSEDLTSKSNEEEEDRRKENDISLNGSAEGNLDGAGSLLQNFLLEHNRRNQSERTQSHNLPPVETEYVSLERLAETVNTCRVCNEKFRDITQLDEHKSTSGHYQCNHTECASLVFATAVELTIHKSQNHGNPASSPRVSRNSPHLNDPTGHVSRNSPHLLTGSRTNSPHGVSIGSPNATSAVGRMNSPMASPHSTNSPHHTLSPHHTHSPHHTNSPHHTHSPTYNPAGHTNNPNQQTAITPVNFEQLPAPVQQLAQQVQRMPLPNLPPGATTMIPGPNYYVHPPGRPPPMYRMPGAPQAMHYAPHMSHIYQQYGPGAGGPYPPMPGPPPPPMHPQMSQQQMPRSRYPSHLQNPRAPRIPQLASAPRQRMKRPLQPPQHAMQQQQQQRSEPANKQRRMDLLLPDKNGDADCHVIVQQKRNDGLPVIQNVQGATVQQTNRSDSTIHLTDSITLSVRQPGSNASQAQNPASGQNPKKPDPKAVANVLAARGITVTPAASKNKSNEPQKQTSAQQQQQQQQQSQSQQRQTSAAPPPPPPVNVTALNLNSAISIIPASSQRKQQEAQQQQQQQQQAQFAVPQNKHPPQSKQQQSSSEVERPPRPPTVDLTQDTPLSAPMVRRGRPPRALLTCQVCDKSFQNQEMLSQHMASHRTNSKLLHKCNLCPAQYPTGQALTMHKQTYHKEVDAYPPNSGIELALPVIDLRSPQVLNRLSSLGIQSYIPLSQLSAQTGGYFGLPIITIDGARNPNSCNLGALGATSILSLGPLKHLSNR